MILSACVLGVCALCVMGAGACSRHSVAIPRNDDAREVVLSHLLDGGLSLEQVNLDGILDLETALDAVKRIYAEGLSGVELYTGALVDLPSAERKNALITAAKVRVETVRGFLGDDGDSVPPARGPGQIAMNVGHPHPQDAEENPDAMARTAARELGGLVLGTGPPSGAAIPRGRGGRSSDGRQRHEVD